MQELGRLVRRKSGFFLAVSLAALALRVLLVVYFPGVVDDSRFYANIANNWLQHGVYGITNSGMIAPTLSRLPGYPAFLAAVFAVFGTDNFRAVLLVQVLFDLATCFLIADLARRLFSERMFSEKAAQAAFLMAGLCPFLANYAATALTETLEVFFTALALDLALSALGIGGAAEGVATWLGCGLAVAGAILLRPDGGILLAAIGGYVFFRLLRDWLREKDRRRARAWIVAGVLLGLGALAPLVPWTLRNLHTFHRFEPLAPRYANDADDPAMLGFNRWTRTWIADYVSVQELYWNVPGGDLDASRLPQRAFDSPEQERATRDLLADYNRDHDVTPEIDARFAALAADRVHAAPLQYYVWLPAVRIADMWLRPRTELFPSDPRWWEFNDDPRWLAVSLAFGAINLAYVLAGVSGLWRSRAAAGIGLLFLFVALRSAFLGTLENPEPRYTLECYPVMIVWAAAWFGKTA